MHLVCLGVMRKLVYIWLKGLLKTRLGPRVVSDCFEKLFDLDLFRIRTQTKQDH